MAWLRRTVGRSRFGCLFAQNKRLILAAIAPTAEIKIAVVINPANPLVSVLDATLVIAAVADWSTSTGVLMFICEMTNRPTTKAAIPLTAFLMLIYCGRLFSAYLINLVLT